MNKRMRNQIIGLGAIAGMRSMMAPALGSRYLYRHPTKRLRRSNLHFMQTERTATIFKVLAVGELVGDKLPFTPNRTEPGSVLGRGLSGALVGAALSRARGKEHLAGAAIGLLSALASTFVSFQLRKELAESTFLPDIFWGALEDVVAVRSGRKLLQ